MVIRGIFKAAPEHAGSTGLVLGVQNGDSPSVEAQYLLLTFREFGLPAVTSTKTALPDPRTLELLVGRQPLH